MKKIVLTTMMILGLIGCGSTCPSEPPRYSKYIEGGGHGMAYHFKLYDVRGDGGAMGGRCTQYTYVTSDVYSDKLGNVTASDIVWIDMRGNEVFSINSDQMNQMRMYLSKQKVVISGYTNEYAMENGTYPVQ